jgi:hypothetical protein
MHDMNNIKILEINFHTARPLLPKDSSSFPVTVSYFFAPGMNHFYKAQHLSVFPITNNAYIYLMGTSPVDSKQALF